MAFFGPVALDVYINAGRIDLAFALAAQVLSKSEDLRILIRMTYLGALEARKRNLKFAESSILYGQTAINLIETRSSGADNAGAIPKDIAIHLPGLYQQIGIIMLAEGKAAEAKKQILQSIALGPKDPSSYALIGRVLNSEYEKFSKAYSEMTEGSDKEEAKKKLDALLDEIIDAYAHAVGLATGKEEHQALLQQVVPDLTSYYKYRNNGSTVGLRTLIQKYRY
jgi:tetratricopeptide (TPR) repeat protein